MAMKRILLTTTAALTGAALMPMAATANTSEIDENLKSAEARFTIAAVAAICKNELNCEKNPLPKNPKNPIPKNPIDVTNAAEVLQCLHFVEAHLTEDGLQPVSAAEVETAEHCLQLFTQGLLE